MLFRREKFNIRRFGSRELRLRINRVHTRRRTFGGPSTSRISRIFTLFKRAKVWKTSLAVFFLLAVYFLFVSNFMLVSNASFAGNNQVSTDRLGEIFEQNAAGRRFLIRKNHFVFMTEGRLNRMFAGVNEIKRVNSNRKWPNGVEIQITERNPGFVLNTGGKSYLIDDEGMAVNESSMPGLPAVVNLNNDELKIGDAALPLKLAAFILSMHRTWPAKINSEIAGIKISKLDSSEVQFDSQESWAVFFDINRSVISQLNNLSIILSQQIPIKDRSKLAYIDLRSDKWVYYCFRGTACSQEPIPVASP